jgi:hypothetical protein
LCRVKLSHDHLIIWRHITAERVELSKSATRA